MLLIAQIIWDDTVIKPWMRFLWKKRSYGSGIAMLNTGALTSPAWGDEQSSSIAEVSTAHFVQLSNVTFGTVIKIWMAFSSFQIWSPRQANWCDSTTSFKSILPRFPVRAFLGGTRSSCQEGSPGGGSGGLPLPGKWNWVTQICAQRTKQMRVNWKKKQWLFTLLLDLLYICLKTIYADVRPGLSLRVDKERSLPPQFTNNESFASGKRTSDF